MPLFCLGRSAVILSLVTALSACSWLGGSKTDPGEPGVYPAERTAQCAENPRSCLYKGRYEKGEREYAELEAARLNRASLERLRQQARR